MCQHILEKEGDMVAYAEQLKEHLTRYKRARLGVQEDGEWKKTKEKYGHILPEPLKRLNLLETIRTEFWEYKKAHPEIKLHTDFHHLTSSQAMAFNLLYPLFGLPATTARPLLQMLGVPADSIKGWKFEHVIDKVEGTNVDFWIQLSSGLEVLLELKLAEQDFGSAKDDEEHRNKLKNIYRARLEGKVPRDVLEPPEFFKRYQILRNISYAARDGRRQVVFVFPQANEALRSGEEFISRAPTPDIRQRIHVLHLEDLVAGLLAVPDQLPPRMATHYALFDEKYLAFS
jgi:hypothetical protein